MRNIVLFDLNIFMILLLLAFLVATYNKREVYNLKRKLFRLIVLGTIIMLTVEIFSWIFDNKTGQLNYFLNFLFNSLFTLLSTVVVSLWASYTDYIIFEDKKRLKRRFYYFYPSIILLVLVVANIFTPILFTIDNANHYSRLPLIFIGYFMAILVYVFVLLMVHKQRDTLNNKVIYGVMIFLLLPMTAALLQLLFFGLLFTWPATAIALIFSYLIVETATSETDFLTGASSRKQAENFIRVKLEKGRQFSVIMIDLDDFKILNDTYGHNAGDKALIKFSKTLNKVFREKAIVSRFGGDEFIIITETIEAEKIQFFRNEILSHLKVSEINYIKDLNFSYGVAYCLDPKKYTMEEIMIEADDKMYLDKAKSKSCQLN